MRYVDLPFVKTGGLVTRLSENPQKLDGLAGVTLGAIIQAISTVISGSALGLIFIWRVGLVGIGMYTSFNYPAHAYPDFAIKHACLFLFPLAISVW